MTEHFAAAEGHDMRQPASASARRWSVGDQQGGTFAANLFRRADA
jgi:hypothetical protein